jgi:hypothetical protein
MFRAHHFLVPVASFALLIEACDRTTAPDSTRVVSYQIPGCTGQGEKRSAGDSCFSYQFHDALVVDFCASGNCCPDSDRFSIQHTVENNTITVTIADTAAHLCRCNCVYVLHVELHDLHRDSYLLVCRREDYAGHEVLYSTWVQRN